MQSKSRFAVGVALFETLLLFVSGVLGNKIADGLNFPSSIVVLLTAICLISLSLISYMKTHDPSATPIKPLRIGASLSRFLPRTMVGIFPIGVVVGFLLGSWIPVMNSGYSGIGFGPIGMYSYEFVGILVALILCLAFAFIIDGPLAGALALGYGLSFATAVLIVRPLENSPVVTYIAYGIGFSLLLIVLSVAEPLFAIIRKAITEPRV